MAKLRKADGDGSAAAEDRLDATAVDRPRVREREVLAEAGDAEEEPVGGCSSGGGAGGGGGGEALPRQD